MLNTKQLILVGAAILLGVCPTVTLNCNANQQNHALALGLSLELSNIIKAAQALAEWAAQNLSPQEAAQIKDFCKTIQGLMHSLIMRLNQLNESQDPALYAQMAKALAAAIRAGMNSQPDVSARHAKMCAAALALLLQKLPSQNCLVASLLLMLAMIKKALELIQQSPSCNIRQLTKIAALGATLRNLCIALDATSVTAPVAVVTKANPVEIPAPFDICPPDKASEKPKTLEDSLGVLEITSTDAPAGDLTNLKPLPAGVQCYEPAKECVVCMEQQPSRSFCCGHSVTCDKCTEQILAETNPRCPVCRASIAAPKQT